MMLSSYNIDAFDRWYTRKMAVLGVAYNKVEGSSYAFEEYDMFEDRPEYRVGRPVLNIEEHTLEELTDIYLTLLEGITAIKWTAGCKTLDEYKLKYASSDAAIAARVKYIEQWLRSTDFFSAPGSSRFHDSEPGGLLKHSLRVYNNMLELMKTEKFNKVDVTSAALVALTHDWCKINYYEPYKKNVKDESTGQWHQEDAYRVNQKGVPLGHGVTSMFLVQKLFNLTPEECLAIRWHMGVWRVCDSEIDELQLANEKYPLVHLLQFADQLALVKY